MKTKPIWRMATTATDRQNPGFGKHWAVGGYTRFTLTCGHEIARKFSQGVPKRFRCRECEKLRAGMEQRSRLAGGPWIYTKWDPVTETPLRIPMTEAEVQQMKEDWELRTGWQMDDRGAQ